MFRKVLSNTATSSIPKIIAKLDRFEKAPSSIKNITKGAAAGALLGTGFWAANKLNTYPRSLKLHESVLGCATFFAITATVIQFPIISASLATAGLVASDIKNNQSVISIKKPGAK